MADILVVDDDILVVPMVEELLTVLGHRVHIAETGRAALALVGEAERRIDLVLLDLELPDGNGLDFFPELLARRPGLSIVLCSGSIWDEDQPGLLARGIRGFLQKPYDLEELKEAVQDFIGPG